MITKKISAFQQIHAAIRHADKGDWTCAITLAAAAEGQIPECDTPHLFKQLREVKGREKIDFNILINWCKHPTGPEEIPLDPIWPVFAVVRAISKFAAAYEIASPEMERFFKWANEHYLLASLPVNNETD